MLFTYLFNLSTNHYIAAAAIFLHNFTYPLLLIILVVALAVCKRRFFTTSLLFLSGVSSWVISEALKFAFHTARPIDALGIHPLVYQGGFSFPSQHMAVFSALALSMFMVNKKFAIVLSIITVCVGISRVVLGVHFPIDILGGLFVGSISSLIIINFYKKI